MKKKLVLKPFAVTLFYGLFLVLVIVGLFFSIKLSSSEENITYVSRAILDEYVPVVNIESEKIIKPFTNEDISITTNYSIIYYENTYIQNPGINYTSNEKYDVLSILDGEVIDVKEDNLLGNTITIKHNNNLISIYGTVDNIKVKKGSKVITGEVIATSGVSTLLNSNYNLHFELYVNGEVVNPENYYGKSLNEV